VRRIPLPEEGGDGQAARGDVELSDEDLAFVQSHAGALGFLQSLPKQDMDRAVSQARPAAEKKAAAAEAQRARLGKRSRSAAAADEGDAAPAPAPGGGSSSDDEDEEEAAPQPDAGGDEEGEAWERRPRRAPAAPAAAPARAGALPIRALDGSIVAAPLDIDDLEPAPLAALSSIPGVNVEDDLAAARQGAAARAAAARAAAAAEAQARREADRRDQQQLQREREQRQQREAGGAVEGAELAASGALRGLHAYASVELRREEARAAMAAAAQAVLADPEAAAPRQLRALLALLRDPDAHVARLAMLSLLAVFRDVLPAYRIRPPPNEADQQQLVSKEVRRVWDYEAALLQAYQQYLKALLEVSGHKQTAVLQPVWVRPIQ
jgi:nucleolar complex protein 3